MILRNDSLILVLMRALILTFQIKNVPKKIIMDELHRPKPRPNLRPRMPNTVTNTIINRSTITPQIDSDLKTRPNLRP